MRIFGVAVRYTGQNMDVPAPSQTAFQSALQLLIDTYPVGDLSITGFTQVTYDGAVTDDGDDLLDMLEDLRGDSTDSYHAVVPVATRGSARTGCGVSFGNVNDVTDAPHEIGHGLGRRHAACLPEPRCKPPPENTDDDYPSYGSFASDSIGEFGFNPVTGQIFDPATTFDFMGYSLPYWVSPYTYRALMALFPPTDGTSLLFARLIGTIPIDADLPQLGSHVEKTPQLFLGLTIDRDRKVTRRPSFHFPAVPRAVGGTRTPFSLELLDKDDRVLVCSRLKNTCTDCDPECFPIRAHNVVPFRLGARTLRVVEGRDMIYEEHIPDPPTVDARAQWDAEARTVRVEWTAAGAGDTELWYLVQGLDRLGAWRGLAPRTQERSLMLSNDAVPRLAVGRIRVLATSGIATGVADAAVDVPRGRGEDRPRVIVTPVDPTLGAGLAATVVLPGGIRPPETEIAWYDESGAEIGRGATIPAGQLSPGHHVLHAVAQYLGQPFASARFVVERDPDGSCHVGTEKSGTE